MEEVHQPIVESHNLDLQIDASSSTPRSVGSEEHREFRRRILTLQAEVEHLHAVQDELIRERNDMDQPPEYNDITFGDI